MEKYVPDIYQKSIYNINYENLKRSGIKCLLFDMDNTLIPTKGNDCNDKMKTLINDLKADFKIMIVSNAPEKRVKALATELDIDYYAFACKPLIRTFKKILEKYKYQECEVAIIGDQLQTDVLGGNRVGITTILVNPISTKDSIFTFPNRILEKRKMNKLWQLGLFKKGNYYD